MTSATSAPSGPDRLATPYLSFADLRAVSDTLLARYHRIAMVPGAELLDTGGL